jgi:ATP diphosphatase
MKNDVFEKEPGIKKLLSLMSMLRDKNFGCPWDLEQTISSLTPHTIEEVYEVIDAIDKNDMDELADELGDLLFQVVFYSQIASEDKIFDFNDVANAISNKLIRRHPHVFPKGRVENFGANSGISSEQVVVNWDLIKKAEKDNKSGLHRKDIETSLLDDVPRALPALERSKKLQEHAAKAGFDWQSLLPVIAKLKEEIAELEEAVAINDNEKVSAEVGDLFFTAVNIARHVKVDPETALRSVNARFENRFKWIESALAEQGRMIEETKLSELDELWSQAKLKGL